MTMSTGDHRYFRKALDLHSEVQGLVGFVRTPTRSFPDTAEALIATHCLAVSPVVQKGPMCGLVALTMAAQLLQRAGCGGPPLPSTDRCHPESILEYTQLNCLSKQGEVFSAETLVDICMNHLDLRAKVVSLDADGGIGALRELLTGIVTGQAAVVVPYDADKDHTPCLARGHKAHWCILVGLCLVLTRSPEPLLLMLPKCCDKAPDDSTHHTLTEGCDAEFLEILLTCLGSRPLQEVLAGDWIFVFARQGKSAHMGLWGLRDLMESNGNLVEVDPRRSDPSEYVLPGDGGLKGGLQNKVVLIHHKMSEQ